MIRTCRARGLILALAVAAGCGRGGHASNYAARPDTVRFVPPAGSIPRNGRILAFESDGTRLVAHQLHKDLVFRLVEGPPVAVDVTESWSISQPCAAVILGLPDAGSFTLEAAAADHKDPLVVMPEVARRWTVSPVADTAPPRWVSPPRAHVPSSCGGVGLFLGLCERESEVEIAVPLIDDHGAVYFHVRLVGSDGSDVQAPVVASGAPAKIVLGSMCQSQFRFLEGVRYRLELTAIDVAGHTAPAPGGPISFEGFEPRKVAR